MDNPASDGFREGVRRAMPSTIGLGHRHAFLVLFIVALVGRSSRPIGDGSGQSSLQRQSASSSRPHLYHSRCNHLFALQLRAHVTQGQHPK